MRTREVDRLWSLLSGEVAGRLVAEGWEAVGADPAPGSMRVCIGRPLRNRFVATIGLSSGFLSGSGGSAVLRPSVRGGIGYEPLIALMPLLGEGRAGVLEEEVGLSADLDQDASARADRGIGPGLPSVSTAADVAVAAEAIARLAPGRALAFAEPLASVDLVLEALRARRDGALAVAEMLAAAGRWDEAVEALARCQPLQVDASPGLERIVDRWYRRSVYQLRRWIDCRGDVALLPPAPPPRDRSAEESSSAGGFGEVRAELAAIKRARRAVADRDRDRSREALRAELDARGLSKSPRWIEDTLDRMWDPAAAQRRLLTGGLKAAVGARLAGSEASEVWNFVKSMRLDGLPGLAAPSWLDPPELALYELPRTGRWTAVVLDSDAREWLEEVWARENTAVAGVLGHLEAWLVPRGECEHGSGSIAVHLGERRVGTIPAAALDMFKDAIEDAAFRQELVFGQARLTKRDSEPLLLLELVTPLTALQRTRA